MPSLIAPACPEEPPPLTVILMSVLSSVSVSSKACLTTIIFVFRPKYFSSGFELTVIFPEPFVKNTLAVDSFLRPVE